MKRILLISLLLLYCVCSFSQTTLTGRVVRVADGDTFTILLESRKQVKVRLHGIDCPEKGQDFGTKAREFTSARVFGKSVRVQVRNKDRYGRVVGWTILSEGKILNKELVRAGLAWQYKEYDQSKELAELENTARKQHLGLWSVKNPIAPWDYRRGKRFHSASTSSRMPSPLAGVSCGARTATGATCKRKVKDGNGRCFQHRAQKMSFRLRTLDSALG